MSELFLTDWVLALTVPVLAWTVVVCRDHFQACVAFIAYGLLLSLSWTRLGAVDVALAEAAVGAGFTGSLFLNALARLGESTAGPRGRFPGLALLVCSGLGAALFAVLQTLPAPVAPAAALVRERLSQSGVSNPVTAVLLNFRALDTLLEVGVMWLAVVGAWSLLPSHSPAPAAQPIGAVMTAGQRLLIPPVLLMTVYLWWVGSSAPGGAFQAAGLLAGAGVSWVLTHPMPRLLRDRKGVRALLAAGFACFLLVAVGTALGEHRRLLEYPRRWSYLLIVGVEALCVVSIGLGFTVLFAARRDGPGGPAR